jgi:hypothetical protein
VVHPVNELEISNACNFKAVRSIGLCGGLEMMDICERSAGGRLENANLFAGCTTKLKFKGAIVAPSLTGGTRSLFFVSGKILVEGTVNLRVPVLQARRRAGMEGA